MSSAGRIAGSLIAIVALANARSVEACGYHDPTSVSRGMLNWVYPKSLYVTSAVWMAQRDGIIARNDEPQATRALLGYRRAVGLLTTLRAHLSASPNVSAMPTFSMVFVGPILWSRYENTGGAIKMTPHLTGPRDGDVVIVSDEAVIAGMLDGRLTPAQGRELGLLRFYGDPKRVQDFIVWFDRLPVQLRADTAKSQK